MNKHLSERCKTLQTCTCSPWECLMVPYICISIFKDLRNAPADSPSSMSLTGHCLSCLEPPFGGVFILQHTSKDRGQKVLVHYGANYVSRKFHPILADQVKQAVDSCVRGEGEDSKKDTVNINAPGQSVVINSSGYKMYISSIFKTS